MFILSGMLFVKPAGATHGCTAANCNPVTVAVIEGQGLVCSSAEGFSSPRCTYHTDPLWSGGLADATSRQGLYCPTRGPGADGPFSFQAGPTALDPPNSVCVSTAGGQGCTFKSKGLLHPGEPSGLGAYAGSSKGEGTSTFTAGDGSLTTEAGFGWDQSAATILPLNGKVTKENGTSVPESRQATVTGFTSSRGFTGGGNCGIDATTPTFRFQVEGMVVTF